VGRDGDGRVVFVAGGAPGDRVRARIVEAKKAFARGELVEIVAAGDARVTPPCPVADRCGGCPWMHVDVAAQLAAKQAIVARALRASGAVVEPIASSPAALGYRTRARMTARGGVLGFSARRSHEVVAVDTCAALDPALDAALRTARATLGSRLGEGGQLGASLTRDGDGARVHLSLLPGHGADRRALQAAAQSLVGRALPSDGADVARATDDATRATAADAARTTATDAAPATAADAARKTATDAARATAAGAARETAADAARETAPDAARATAAGAARVTAADAARESAPDAARATAAGAARATAADAARETAPDAARATAADAERANGADAAGANAADAERANGAAASPSDSRVTIARAQFETMPFAQANAAQNETLRKLVRDAAGAEGARVLELYAGDGNFTRDLAAVAASGLAVEGDAAAVSRARAAVSAAAWQWRAAPVEDAVAELARAGQTFDVVVLDPPRAGAAAAIAALAKLGAARIVYVSCDPMTLARDVAALGKLGYRATRAWPVDMMPHTFHVETVCLLERAA
jgi:tRNA/tmRNA/rRNA uracil-C5-methylase (TrmA/RlmC/RlmD family)